MSPTATKTYQSISAGPDGATKRLLSLMRQRELLNPLFLSTWDRLAARFDPNDLEEWASGVLELTDVNAGPSCLIAFWNVSKSERPDEGLAALTAAAFATANICRHAGAQAAAATIAAFVIARRMLCTAEALSRWWRIMMNLSHLAPESVEAAARHMGETLPSDNIDAFDNFVAAGLKLASGNKQRRLAFFSMRDEVAQRLVARASAGIGFADVERQTKAFVTALWGCPPQMRALTIAPDQSTQLRSTMSGPLVQLPEFYRGIEGDAVRALYRAAAAHAQAHLIYGGARFPIGTLKPLQVALVTLIEDARIEMLAMRDFPGLRRLWSPFHVAATGSVATAPTLLARLARALFDPSYADDNGFISKGRGLFEEAFPRITDQAISREIGMLLGNDLGQMRVQYNAKTYVIEPLYRDDGFGLWDFGKNVPQSDSLADVMIDAARVEHRDDPGQGELEHDSTVDANTAGRALRAAEDQRGAVIAKYPEWDRVHGVERPEWTTVREVRAREGDTHVVEESLEQAIVLRSRIKQLVRGVNIGRTVRLKRQFDGQDMDLDAMLDAGVELRMRQKPDPRIFCSSMSQHRDLTVLILIDISESTRDRLKSGTTILDVERLAVAVLAEAMNELHNPFCLLAFASNGRDDVQMTSVKTFDEPYDRACIRRLAGLSSGLSTRLGTALKHAGQSIIHAPSFRKLVIVLTDGEPSDIDAADQQDLVEDARRAAIGLKACGIDGFGVVLDPDGMNAAARIFGRGNTMLVHRAEELPSRLSELYFRLARR